MICHEEIIQDDPVIQNLLAMRELAGEARGKIGGETQGIKDSILSILSIRFSPMLAV